MRGESIHSQEKTMNKPTISKSKPPASVTQLRLAEHTPRMALTDRELQMLNHIAKGLRNKEIGAALNIAEDTVKIHIKNIFGKLNVIDRTAAVVSASQRGIIELDYAH